MHDPQEGVTSEGLIRTGASRRAITASWDAVLDAAVEAVDGQASLYVYGSVATGCAVASTSDVDLLSIGLPADEAERVSRELSVTFADRCRGVSIAPAGEEELDAETNEGYGLCVFLRHYCVHLSGPDPADGLPAYRQAPAQSVGSTGTSRVTCSSGRSTSTAALRSLASERGSHARPCSPSRGSCRCATRHGRRTAGPAPSGGTSSSPACPSTRSSPGSTRRPATGLPSVGCWRDQSPESCRHSSPRSAFGPRPAPTAEPARRATDHVGGGMNHPATVVVRFRLSRPPSTWRGGFVVGEFVRGAA